MSKKKFVCSALVKALEDPPFSLKNCKVQFNIQKITTSIHNRKPKIEFSKSSQFHPVDGHFKECVICQPNYFQLLGTTFWKDVLKHL